MSLEMTTEQTLRDLAEAGASSVTASPFLAERVLALHHRSQRRRRIGASLALVGLVAGGSVAARSPGESRFSSVYEPSYSMAPTVTSEEHLIVDRTLVPSRGDLVELTGTNGGQQFHSIRRVMGLPGDAIACPAGKDGYCHGWTRNGQVLTEPYVGRDQAYPRSAEEPAVPGFFIDGGDRIAPYQTVTVSAGHLFVLGDNRDNAVDSRMYGLMKMSGIDGVGVQVVGKDGRRRAIPGAPAHEVPGPGGTIDPPAPLPTAEGQPVETQPTG